MFEKLLSILLMLFFTSIGLADNPKKIILTKSNTIVIDTPFEFETVSNVAYAAKLLESSSEPLYLVINSPGGVIDAGLELIENLNSLNRPVYTLTLFAASMGFQTVQGVNGKRLILSTGTLMSHKAQGGFNGEFPGQLDSRYDYYLRRIGHMNKITVARTKGKHTLESYEKLIENEYWCQGQDCVDQGFADSVVLASCDKTLSKLKTMSKSTSFVGMDIDIEAVFSECPLISGPISIKTNVNGRSIYEHTKLSKDDIVLINNKVTELINSRVNKVPKVVKK